MLRAVAGGLKRPPGARTGLPRPRGPLGWLGLAMALAGLVWIAMAALALWTGTSLAQTPPVPDLSGEPDRAGRALLAFLSDLDAGNNTALSGMLTIYNGAILVLAGVLLVWWTAAGTVDTASRGRWGFTGKETLRITAAFLLMVPLAGGLSGGQHIALSLARTGGDIAQVVWGEFSRDVLGSGTMVAPPPHQRPLRSAIAGIFLAELCARTANLAAREVGDRPYVEVTETQRSSPLQQQRRGYRGRGFRALGYDGRAGGMPKGMCGSVRLSGLDNGATPGGRMAEAQSDAFDAIRPALGGIADRVALWFAAPPGTVRQDGPLPDIEELLVEADPLGVYLATVGTAADATRDEATDALETALQEEAENSPWTLAASLFMTITRHVGEYQLGAGTIPRVAGPSARLSELVPQASAAVTAAAEQLAGSAAYPAVMGAGAAPAPGAGGIGEIGRGSLDRDGNKAMPQVDSGNPILDLVSLGHSLVTKALGSILLLGGLATGSNLLNSIPLIGGGLDAFEAAWQVMDSFVSTILGIMILAGLVLAYLVPVLPFLRFLFGLLAWLVAVIAAVFAMPVWLAGHTVRGEGFVTQATRQGWLFLPGLILRPVLMLFGLVTGYLLFVTIMDTFNDVFRGLVFDAGASDGIGVLGWLAMLAIYLMTVYGLMNGCFKLIDHLPGVAMDWLGGRDGAGGDADRLGGGIAGAFGRGGPMRVGQGRRGGRAPTGRGTPAPDTPMDDAL
ncbi:MAG: DotA/TraY family protein [Alphaproteobacteria bacterium]|nr:DotA/TraY family protein [Alphaproteobacteria bacterium]